MLTGGRAAFSWRLELPWAAPSPRVFWVGASGLTLVLPKFSVYNCNSVGHGDINRFGLLSQSLDSDFWQFYCVCTGKCVSVWALMYLWVNNVNMCLHVTRHLQECVTYGLCMCMYLSIYIYVHMWLCVSQSVYIFIWTCFTVHEHVYCGYTSVVTLKEKGL